MGSRAEQYQRIALFVVLGAGVAAALAGRLYIGWGLPLWLDESWTAMISAEPTLRGALHEIWADSNAPLYYLVTWLLPGESDAALRLPSLAFMLAAAALPLLWKPPGLSPEARATWGALLFLWAPGLAFSADARPYALLLLVCTAQTIAFVRLLDVPGTARAALWVGLAGTAILTHYFAVFPATVQGIVYLARVRSLRAWPALFALVPALAWGLLHLPRLLVYATPGIAWYYVPTSFERLYWVTYPLGGTIAFGMALAVILVLCQRRAPPLQPSPVALTALSGVLAVAALLMLTALRPMMVDRYMTPSVPVVLLGVVLLARGRIGYLAVALLYIAAAADPRAARAIAADRANYGLEVPARLLAPSHPARLVYSLGYAGETALLASTQAKLGAVAFARAGAPLPAQLVPTTGADPDRKLTAAAGGDAAILWLYNATQRSAARRIKAERPCFDIPRGAAGALACPALTASASHPATGNLSPH